MKHTFKHTLKMMSALAALTLTVSGCSAWLDDVSEGSGGVYYSSSASPYYWNYNSPYYWNSGYYPVGYNPPYIAPPTVIKPVIVAPPGNAPQRPVNSNGGTIGQRPSWLPSSPSQVPNVNGGNPGPVISPGNTRRIN